MPTLRNLPWLSQSLRDKTVAKIQSLVDSLPMDGEELTEEDKARLPLAPLYVAPQRRGAARAQDSGDSQDEVARSVVGSPEPISAWIMAAAEPTRGPQNCSVSRISPRIMCFASGMQVG